MNSVFNHKLLRITGFFLLFVICFQTNVFAEDRWIAEDKLKHFGVSAFMAMFSYKLSRHHFEMSENEAVFLSAGFTFTIGGAKEINDSRHPRETSSLKDLAADILGIAVGIFIITRQ